MFVSVVSHFDISHLDIRIISHCDIYVKQKIGSFDTVIRDIGIELFPVFITGPPVSFARIAGCERMFLREEEDPAVTQKAIIAPFA